MVITLTYSTGNNTIATLSSGIIAHNLFISAIKVSSFVGGYIPLVSFICVFNKFIIIAKCYLLRVNKIMIFNNKFGFTYKV